MDLNGVALCGCDVAESRFTQELLGKRSYGLQPGFFIDLTAMRDDSNYWDLGRDEDQQMLNELQEKERPQLLIGSPPCTSFCPLLRLSKSEDEIQEARSEGVAHLRVCIDAYTRQLQNGCHFLHEHPAYSASCKEPEMQ
eukprot:326784-Amphidinium_carterae.1